MVYSNSTQILYITLDILTIFVHICEYSMCESRIVVAIKCNKFSAKYLKNIVVVFLQKFLPLSLVDINFGIKFQMTSIYLYRFGNQIL